MCDEFVIDDKRNNVHYLMNYDDVIDEINNGRIYDEDVIYGAIWTDKGLIYVAKMNNVVDNQFKISNMILKNNYYKKVFIEEVVETDEID